MSYFSSHADVDDDNRPDKKRARSTTDDGTSPHQTSGLDIGTQTFHGHYDGNGLYTTGKGVLPQVSTAAHTCMAGDGLFVLEDCDSSDVKFRKLVNELVEKFSQLYAGNVFMINLATETAIRPTGCVKETVLVSENDKCPSLNNMYIGERNFATVGKRALAGQRMKWVVRSFGPTLASNTHGKDDFANSYGIYLTPVTDNDVGLRFAKAAAELIYKFDTWTSALAGFPGVAEPWVAAVFADDRHMKFAGIVMIERALEKGLLAVNVPTAAGGRNPGLVRNVSTAYDPAGGNQVRVANELTDNGAVPESYEVAARIADLMGLTTPQDSLLALLDSASTATYQEFAHEVTQSLYYTMTNDIVNSKAEFGASWGASGPTYAGRFQQQGSSEPTANRVGQVLQLQMVHASAAVSAFRHAIAHDDKMFGGTATGNTVHGITPVMLHK